MILFCSFDSTQIEIYQIGCGLKYVTLVDLTPYVQLTLLEMRGLRLVNSS